ncbi:MAG: protein kinase [Elusimicrobiota bacterium]
MRPPPIALLCLFAAAVSARPCLAEHSGRSSPSGRAVRSGPARPAGGASAGAVDNQGRYKDLTDGCRRRIKAGDLAGAIRQAEEAIRLLPGRTSAHNLKARAFNMLGRFEDAEKVAQRSIEMGDKALSVPYQNLILAQLHLGLYREALENADRAIDEKKLADAELFALRAFAYEGLGQDGAKRIDIDRAAKLAPERYKRLAQAARMGGAIFLPEKGAGSDRWTGGIAEADALIRAAPEDPWGYQLKAARSLQAGRFGEAAQAARRAIVLIPRANIGAWHNLIFAQLNSGRSQEAQLSSIRATELIPGDAQLFAFRAYAHEQLGQEDAKLDAIRRAAELDQANYQAKLDTALRGERMFFLMTGRKAGGPAALLRDLSGRLGWPAVLGAAALVLGSLGAIGYGAWRRALAARQAEAEAMLEMEDDDEGGLLAGKYRFTRIIGKGGMGQVWAATDESLGRVVAIKKMTEELGKLGSKAREFYLKEARTVASLHHPHIIGIYEILDRRSGLYLVFEMASGKTVQHILAESRRLSVEKAREILSPVCEALDFAHSRSIVHRDLKPANIMLTDQGFVKVMDFGIARKISEEVGASDGRQAPVRDKRGILTDHTMTIVGTPVYMSPEAEQGVVTPVSDIFSMGACLYEMVTGHQPFDARAGMMIKIDRGYIKPSAHVPELPEGVDALIDDSLDPNPETRIPSVREFSARLDRLCGEREDRKS